MPDPELTVETEHSVSTTDKESVVTDISTKTVKVKTVKSTKVRTVMVK